MSHPDTSILSTIRVNVDTSRMEAATAAAEELTAAIQKMRKAIKELGMDLTLVSVEEDGEETKLAEYQA